MLCPYETSADQYGIPLSTGAWRLASGDLSLPTGNWRLATGDFPH
jgi:hypothetical protein